LKIFSTSSILLLSVSKTNPPISENNKVSIHVPKGCANAFLTLEDNCLIHYYCSNSYNPKYEKGIRYNDPNFDFDWPANPKIISEKDLNHRDFQ